MILELYKQLKQIAQNEFGDIVENAQIILSNTGRARKLRVALIDTTFVDVWYSLDGDYSIHWDQSGLRNTIYRHDNAPHLRWSYVKTFPKHCHDGSQDSVVDSYLPDEPRAALREFLKIARKRIAELKTHGH